MTTTTLTKESKFRLAYSINVLVHCHYIRKHGSIQADMLLEKELRILHLDPQAAGRERHWAWLGLQKTSKPTPSDTLLPTRSYLLFFQIMPLPGNQSSKYISLWGQFSFKPSQPPCCGSVHPGPVLFHLCCIPSLQLETLTYI